MRSARIQRQRLRIVGNSHALGQHDLEDVAVHDVFATLAYRLFESLLWHGRRDVLLCDAGSRLARRRRGQPPLEFGNQPDQPLPGPVPGVGLRRVGMDHHQQPTGQIVKDHDLFGDHKQNIRRADGIRLGISAEMRLDVFYGVVAEIADKAAGKPGQFLNFGNTISILVFANRVQGLVVMGFLNHFAAFDIGQRVAANLETGMAGQANNRIASPLLAPLDRLEQVTPGPGGEFQIGAERRFKVGEDLDGDGNTVVALVGVLVKLVLGEHGDSSQRRQEQRRRINQEH